jgi:hypothetical protein
MRRGTPVIYVSLLAYDTIAHHVGMGHPLSTAALRQADGVVGAVAGSASEAARPYHLIVLSDHGQTAGASFESVYRVSLEQLVSSLMSEPDEAGPETTGMPGLVVSPSGNLANVSFPGRDHRLGLEELEAMHPGMLTALAEHPGIGFVMVDSDRDGLVALGPAGIHYLDQGRVTGEDPLARFGQHAAASLRRLGSFRNAGDIVVNSTYDPEDDVVAPFESQVSSHGGLGGAQTEAFIIYPSILERSPRPLALVGAESVNAKLREWGVGEHSR